MQNISGKGGFFFVFPEKDFMSDFISTIIFEFNVKSYVNSEIARS